MSLKRWSAGSLFCAERESMWGMGVSMKSVCESESLVNLPWILMLLLCPQSVFPSVKWRQWCFPFSLRHAEGDALALLQFPRVALYTRCWQCPHSCAARRMPFALQRLQFFGTGNCVTQFACGRSCPKPTPNACSKIFFHNPLRRYLTPFLGHALLGLSAIYAHLRLLPFCLLRHLLAD